jgi:hypothetical protein
MFPKLQISSKIPTCSISHSLSCIIWLLSLVPPQEQRREEISVFVPSSRPSRRWTSPRAIFSSKKRFQNGDHAETWNNNGINETITTPCFYAVRVTVDYATFRVSSSLGSDGRWLQPVVHFDDQLANEIGRRLKKHASSDRDRREAYIGWKKLQSVAPTLLLLGVWGEGLGRIEKKKFFIQPSGFWSSLHWLETRTRRVFYFWQQREGGLSSTMSSKVVGTKSEPVAVRRIPFNQQI